MVNRRGFLGITAGAGAALALAPELLRAHQASAGTLLQRSIPSSCEKLPVISSNPQQESDAAGMNIGRLPNAAMRKRMAQVVDSLPEPPAPPPPSSSGRTVVTPEQMKQRLASLTPTVALSAAMLDSFAGEYQHAAVGTIVTVRRDGDGLIVKVHGNVPEEFPFVARSETRFASVLHAIEFQVDAQGKVTGATWGQNANSIPLVRR